jgi:hypothetical protein
MTIGDPYSPHPGIAMVRNWIETLPEKTGRSLADWLRLIEDQGPAAEKERVAWLKSEHGLGTPVASLADIDGEVRGWLQTAYEMDA